MRVSPYRRRESEPLDDLRALLQGRVFHVTRLAALQSILDAGEVRANQDRSLPTTFGYLENGYFRNRGCVALFDTGLNYPSSWSSIDRSATLMGWRRRRTVVSRFSF